MEIADNDESESMGEASEADVKWRQENGHIEQSLSILSTKDLCTVVRSLKDRDGWSSHGLWGLAPRLCITRVGKQA